MKSTWPYSWLYERCCFWPSNFEQQSRTFSRICFEDSHVVRSTDDHSKNVISNTSFIEILMLKVGKSAITAYPIPAEVKIFCPTDQQQQTNNEPLLLVSKNYKLLTSVAAEIKSYKVPDVYKGSGIFLCERLETSEGDDYINETILRKEIKKK